MKIDTKDLQKALDWLRKEGGNPQIVEISLDFLHRVEISSYTDFSGNAKIKLYDSDSAKMAEIIKTERL